MTFPSCFSDPVPYESVHVCLPVYTHADIGVNICLYTRFGKLEWGEVRRMSPPLSVIRDSFWCLENILKLTYLLFSRIKNKID